MRGFIIVGLLVIVSVAIIGSLRGLEWRDDAPMRGIPAYVPPKAYVCHRASGPIKIDGKLDEAAWHAVPWTNDFVDIEGDVKPTPRFRTRAKMLWDDDNFYVAAELEEPHLSATLTERDSVIFNDNDFEVFIDPNGDNHEYYEFEMNALNTQWDLFLTKPYRDGGKPITGWDIAGLKTGVHVDGTINDPRDLDKGWTIEIAMPWQALKEAAGRPTPPTEGDQWRVNFSRVEWLVDVVEGKYRKVPNRREDNWVWSPQGVIDMHRPETWGYVQFTRQPPGAVTYQPDPSGLARYLAMQIYYAQREHRERAGAFAGDLRSLGLQAMPHATEIRLDGTATGFEVAVPVMQTGRHTGTIHVRDDSRITLSNR